MNTRLLRRVAKHIAAEPRRFQMGDWIIKKEDGLKQFTEYAHAVGQTRHNFAPCGTAACIGGWAEILSKTGDARAALDLDWEEGEKLFHVNYWPDEFRGPYENAMTPAKRVRIAVARIEHFIKTKGAE